MGPGGLFLASDMAERVPIGEGQCVLDLGCGRANTSLFLARAFNVSVHAVDLWISASENLRTVRRENLDDRVVPLNLDITKRLPFADGYFDIIFCMDAFHYFGARRGFLAHIAKHLKSGGYIVVGNPCFDREFTAPPPSVYRPPWVKEFSKYHSPLWWKNLFEESELFDASVVEEPANGIAYWEDDVLSEIDSGTCKETPWLEAGADQIVFGRDNPAHPYLTHYILHCRKR